MQDLAEKVVSGILNGGGLGGFGGGGWWDICMVGTYGVLADGCGR